MKDKIIHIETENKNYPLVFNLNVMEELQEKYGTIQKWGEVVESGEEPKIKDLKYGLMVMINEGIDIENESRDKKEPFLTSKQVGRLISEVGFEKIIEDIKNITKKSTETGEEPKNM